MWLPASCETSLYPRPAPARAGWLVLRVEDDGQGFDPAAPASGIGLRTLHNRVALLGGTVHLITEPGRGTECQIRIPVAAA